MADRGQGQTDVEQGVPVNEVEILMGVHNGVPYLPAQLESLSEQTYSTWRLTVSDDSPTVESAALITEFGAGIAQPVTVRPGPRKGFAANYMHLLRQMGEGHVALADQDDVWLPDKLARAMGMLAEAPPGRPALYCARSIYWDGAERRQPSPVLGRPTSFRNALIENVAQGNTIVMNPAAAGLVREAAHLVPDGTIFAHDWWLYLLLAGAGGHVIVDNGPPPLLYRQHAQNLIGSGAGLSAQIRRKQLVLAGAFGERLMMNIAALRACGHLLLPETRSTLEAFATVRRRPVLGRLAGLGPLRLYRQSYGGTLRFWGAALLGRI